MRHTCSVFIVFLFLVGACNVQATPVFKLKAHHAGAQTWTYTLTNYSTAGEKAEGFTLDWNPIDGNDDLNQAAANFDQYTGYTAVPDGWMSSPGPFPSFTAVNVLVNAVAPGQSLEGVTLQYGNQQNHIPASWFRVTYRSGIYEQTSGVLAIESADVPEPGGIVTLLAGLAGALGSLKLRRRPLH